MDIVWLKIIWLHLAALRLMLCILPQTGIVSENEFASTEIMATHIFGILSNQGRHVDTHGLLFPGPVAGTPFLLLRYISQFFQGVVSPYTLLLFPRLVVTLLSFSVDVNLYRTAMNLYNNQIAANLASIVFASSYSSWIYCTRTVPVVFNVFILVCILNLITKPTEKINIFAISFLAVFGTFIDWYFLSALVMPIIYWLFSETTDADTFFKGVPSRLVKIVPSILFATAVLVICRCLYFDPDLFNEVYNIQDATSMIQWFGKQQRWLPLIGKTFYENNDQLNFISASAIDKTLFLGLFGTLFFVTVEKVNTEEYFAMLNFKMIRASLLTIIFYSFIFNINKFFITMCIIVFLVLIFAPFMAKLELWQMSIFASAWVSFNLGTFIIQGMLADGGMLPCIEYISSIASVHKNASPTQGHTELHFHFYHTSTPPLHLLNWQMDNIAELSILHMPFSSYKDLEVNLNSSLATSGNPIVYLVLPGAIPCSDLTSLQNTYHAELYFEFFPHLSVVDVPWLSTSGCSDASNIVYRTLDVMTLHLYRIQHFKNKKVITPGKVNLPTSVE